MRAMEYLNETRIWKNYTKKVSYLENPCQRFRNHEYEIHETVTENMWDVTK
jgi:hypothetical protein